MYHSGVIRSWRRREAELRKLGWDVVLVTALRWNEGGTDVHVDDLEPDTISVRTIGRHPALFVYDPRPIVRLLRDRRFDVLDFHEEPFSLAAAELAVLRMIFGRRAPMLLYTAQNIKKRYPPPFRWIETWLLRAAAAIYPCSAGAAAVVRAKGAAGIVEEVPLGVDLDAFVPANVGEHDLLLVGYFGRLLPQKGVDVAIRAIAAVEDARLTVVGDGPERSHLESLALKLGVADRVTFAGFVPHDDLAAMYRSVDVVVVPSLPTPSWVEQFCRVAVEAMASGVPVIASACGALPEVVAGGGVTFPPGDVPALAARLEELRDPAGRAALVPGVVRRGRAFDWAAVARQHAALYERVLRR